MKKEYGYEFEKTIDANLWDKTQNLITTNKINGAYCFRSGRDALKTIALKSNSRIVLLPALACSSMIMPFLNLNYEIHYYKLTKDFSVDVDDVLLILKNLSGSIIFVFMNYLGIDGLSTNDINLIRFQNKDIVFVEDKTHNIFSAIKSSVNYTIASVRKWVDIPDGGLLWTQDILDVNSFSIDTTFTENKLMAQSLRYSYLNSNNQDENIKNQYRSIFSSLSNFLDNNMSVGMSLYSYKQFQLIDWFNVKQKRINNSNKLKTLLTNAGISVINHTENNPELFVGILCNNRDRLQRTLAKNDIFCTILWPLSKLQQSNCEFSKNISDNMLAIYCDQRYSFQDMEYISKKVIELYE